MLGPLLISLMSFALPTALSAHSPGVRLVDGAVVLCSDASLASEVPSDDEPIYDCAAPQLPAVLDCDDAETLLFGEMLGSCEQPSQRGPLPASLLGDERLPGKRVCTSDRCGFDRKLPLPAGPRPHSDTPLVASTPLRFVFSSSSDLTISTNVLVPERTLDGLFRPPRL